MEEKPKLEQYFHDRQDQHGCRMRINGKRKKTHTHTQSSNVIEMCGLDITLQRTHPQYAWKTQRHSLNNNSLQFFFTFFVNETQGQIWQTARQTKCYY